jgi:hypothetical protein
MPTRPVTIFYSYSHKDEKHRDALSSSLALLKREGLIKEWHDGDILPGQKWEDTIYQQLDSADVVLMLVSRDFINSDFIWGNELQRAIERENSHQARVIPVILRPTDWQNSPLGTLQALPKNGKPITLWANRDAALLDVEKGIRKAIEDLRAGIKSTHVRTVSSARTVQQKLAIAESLATKRTLKDTRIEHSTTQLRRVIFTAGNRSTLPGTVARREGDPATGDEAVDEAYDCIGAAYNSGFGTGSRLFSAMATAR